MNTHYGVITFTGDPAWEHDDPDLRGQPPSLTMIAFGPEEFCWESLRLRTEYYPLKKWQAIEVLARDPKLVEMEYERARQHRERHDP